VKFIIAENRSTFFSIHAAKAPKKSSAGLGKISAEFEVVPKAISFCLFVVSHLLLK